MNRYKVIRKLVNIEGERERYDKGMSNTRVMGLLSANGVSSVLSKMVSSGYPSCSSQMVSE